MRLVGNPFWALNLRKFGEATSIPSRLAEGLRKTLLLRLLGRQNVALAHKIFVACGS